MFDVYKEITDRFIAALEAGTVPWHKPWFGGNAACISYSTGKPYSFLNQILLGGRSGEYITFKQAVQAGGYVKKGEKARMVVFWKPYEEVDQDTGEVTKHFFLRYYNVFHLDQCEGIMPRWAVSVQQPASVLKPDDAAEAVIRDYVDRSHVKLTICRSDKAYYSPLMDEIVVPELSQYNELSEYYSTLFHEMTHSTGSPSRLNRIKDVAAFGSESYSKEELVAELGSAFLVHHVGLETPISFNNSAAYLQGWLKALRDDRRLVVYAAGAAEKAVSLILNTKEADPDVGTET